MESCWYRCLESLFGIVVWNRLLESFVTLLNCNFLFTIFRGERKMLCGSFNPGLDLKVSRGHGLGTPPWYRSIPDGTNIYYVFKTGLNRTYDKTHGIKYK